MKEYTAAFCADTSSRQPMNLNLTSPGILIPVLSSLSVLRPDDGRQAPILPPDPAQPAAFN